MNKKLLLVIVLILILGLVLAFFASRRKSTSLEKTATYKIENIPYNYGSTDCCYCAAIMAMMGHTGITKNKIQDYWLDFGNPGDVIKLYRFLKTFKCQTT